MKASAQRADALKKKKTIDCICWFWASFRHFRKICTIKLFPMKKFERSDDSKFHPYIGFWWFVTTTKKNKPTPPKSQIFDTFRVLSLHEKSSTTIFFVKGKLFFFFNSRLYDQVLKKCSGVRGQTVKYSTWVWLRDLIFNHNVMFLEIFQVSRSDQTPFPEVTKLQGALYPSPISWANAS